MSVKVPKTESVCEMQDPKIFLELIFVINDKKILVPLDDAGEFIPYARKHMMPEADGRLDQPEDTKPNKSQKIKLVDIWPEPDWLALRNSGVDPYAVASMFMYYTNIRKSPRDDHWGVSREKWEFAFIQSIDLFKKLFANVRTADDAKAMPAEYLKALPSVVPDFSESPKHIKNRYAMYATGRCNSRKTISNAFHLTPRKRLVKEWLIHNGWPENAQATNYSFFPIQMQDGSWRVAETDKTSYFWYDKPVSRQEAIEQCFVKNADAHPLPSPAPSPAVVIPIDIKPPYTPKRKARNTETRVGPEHRKGDVSPEELISTFGFRGIQFGNALSNVERQEWVNNAFDAFHDLAFIIGFKPAWIGLPPNKHQANDHALGIAFGARGIGGSNASAHYEIDLNVINLTRASGFGSAAHEWFHGLDARIGKKLGANDFITKSFLFPPIREAIHFGNLDLGPRTVNQIKSFYKIVTVCEKSQQFYAASCALESQRRAKKYWTKPWELFARCGEAFIQDKLSEHNIYSPWLVNGTLASDCEYQNLRMWPYPTGAERETLNQFYGRLFESLRT